MVQDVLPGLRPPAGDHVEHTGWEDVGDQLGELEHRQGCQRGRLEDGAAAGCQDRRQFPGGHQEREVPRDDLPDHADGFTQHQREGVFAQQRGGALFGPDRRGEVAEVVGGERHVDGGGLTDRLAVVVRLDQGQVLGVGFDDVRDAVQDCGPLGGLDRFPGGEGRPGGFDRRVDVFLGGFGDVGEFLAVGRTGGDEGGSVRSRPPFTVDE